MAYRKEIGVRGKVVSSQSREVIANVLRFMKEEAAKGEPIIPITNFKQRLIKATGVSEKTYIKINKEIRLFEKQKSGRLAALAKADHNYVTQEMAFEEIKVGPETVLQT